MASCLVFIDGEKVMDLKMKLETPVFYFANVSSKQKEAYPVHEYIRVDPESKVKRVYQLAYAIEPAEEVIERAILELKAVPIYEL